MRARYEQLWGLLLRFGFRLLYQEMAWSYDTVSWLVSFGAWRAWQRSAVPYMKGPKVLELGHGPGHMLLALQQSGYQVTGIDLSPQMGAISRRRLQKAGIQVRLLRGLAQQLPFQPQSFDSVLATFPTDYIIAADTLTAVHRVLRDNGRFIIVPQAQFTGNSLPERFVEWLYLITGQRQEKRNTHESSQEPTNQTIWHTFQDHFHRAGFTQVIETVPLPHSEVIIIVATKQKDLFGLKCGDESV